jgi:AraC family transcriptional regulator, exoenzyme S synthesis regulatory protein ExsA
LPTCSNSDGDFYEILVFHLHAATLKKLYRQEFPAFLKKDNEHLYIQKIASKDIIRKFIENLDFYFENPAFINDDILEPLPAGKGKASIHLTE